MTASAFYFNDTGFSNPSPPVIVGETFLDFNDASFTLDGVPYDNLNCFDNNPGTYTELAATGATIIINCGATVDCDFLGWFGTNLADFAGNIALAYSDDSVIWTNVANKNVTKNGPDYFTFSTVNKKYWRITITANGLAKLAILYLGKKLTLISGQTQGATVPEHGHSPGGAFTRSGLWRRRKPWKSTIDFRTSDIPEDWMRDYWFKFLNTVRTKPIFLLWSSVTYNDKIAFGVIENIKPMRYTRTTGYFDLSFRFVSLFDDQDDYVTSVDTYKSLKRFVSVRDNFLNDVATIIPTGIVSAETFGTSTVSVGALTVTLSGIESEEVFPTPAIGELLINDVGAITSSETFGTCELTTHTVTVTITGIASGEAFGAITLMTGTVSITLSSIITSETFGTLSVATSNELSVYQINSAEAFGSLVCTGPVTVTSITTIEAFGTSTVTNV